MATKVPPDKHFSVRPLGKGGRGIPSCRFDGKENRAPTAVARKHWIEPWKYLGAVVLVFPHLKPTATTWSGRRGGEHVRLGERSAVAAASLLRDAWLREAAREGQAPLPWLRGATLDARTTVTEFMPRLRGIALGARVPSAEFGPWPRGTVHEARVPVVKIVPWLRGTALETPVPSAVLCRESLQQTA